MEFVADEIDRDVMILRADGGLNAANSGEFVDQLTTLVESGVRKIIVDCSGLTYVSSAGLGTLVLLHRRLKDLGGDVKIAGLSGAAAQVLSLTRLDRLLQIYADVDRARLAFRPAASDA